MRATADQCPALKFRRKLPDVVGSAVRPAESVDERAHQSAAFAAQKEDRVRLCPVPDFAQPLRDGRDALLPGNRLPFSFSPFSHPLQWSAQTVRVVERPATPRVRSDRARCG